MEEIIILICGHGYHVSCYNFLENVCKWCKEYYEKGIDENVESFLKRLNKNDNRLTTEDVDENLEDDDNEEENNVIVNPDNSERVLYEVQAAIDDVKNW
jgi:hypothetical protein